jgi:hypothetical protein
MLGIRPCFVLAINRYRVPRKRHCVLRGRLTARALYSAIPLVFRVTVARCAPKTIRALIDDRVKVGKKPATVKRYVATTRGYIQRRV